MRPDIWIKAGSDNIVLDTKWKNLGVSNPSFSDLRQMYVYHEYYSARKVGLVYPGKNSIAGGKFYEKESDGRISDKECSLISVGVDKNVAEWQGRIGEMVFEEWMEIKNLEV